MDGEISCEKLKGTLEEDEKPLIVDIRNPRQFERVRIEDSINIPLSQLPQQVEQLCGEDHIVTVCPHGQASVRAARLVTSFEGFDGRVESLECGISGWDGPIEGADVASADQQESPDTPF
jgi:rhodanese-related sulfurtransferase